MTKWATAIACAVILALACALLAAPAPAHAAGIQEGQATTTVYSTKVAFGNETWWVVGDNSTGVYPATGSITLLAEGLNSEWTNQAFRLGNGTTAKSGYSPYRYQSPSGYWSEYEYYINNDSSLTTHTWVTPDEYLGSTLHQDMNKIATSFIPSEESALINKRTISEGIAGFAASNQKVWSLSLSEFNTIKNAGASSVLAYGNSGEYYWLRSPYETSNGYKTGRNAIIVSADGTQMWSQPIDYTDEHDIRPALSLNLSSVLFTSSATGGKGQATAGGALVSASAPTGTVKYTFRDNTNQHVTANTAKVVKNATSGEYGFQIAYSNATTGTNQYVSCVLKDASGNVVYYGKLVNCSNSSAASGTITLGSTQLANVADGAYTLGIFSEQANGSTNSDFASTPTTQTIYIKNKQPSTVTDTSGSLALTKNYSLLNLSATAAAQDNKDNAWGNDGRATTTFTMILQATRFTSTSGNAVTDKDRLKEIMPIPDGNTWTDGTDYPYITKDVNNSNKKAEFGNLTFTQPGTYDYVMYELVGNLSGVTYGGDCYHVIFTVTASSDGSLSVTARTVKVNDVSGVTITPPTTTDTPTGTATVYNYYSTSKIGIMLSVVKELTDNSGARPLQTGDFHFKVGKATDASGAEFDVTSAVPQLVDANGIANYDKTEGVPNDEDGDVGLGELWLNTTDLGNTYYYPFNEISGSESGMTYDTTQYRAAVKATNSGGAITATVTYQRLDGTSWVDITGTPTFNNTYSVIPASIAGGFTVQKTLTGRDGVESESYTFTATLTSETNTGGVKASSTAADPVSVGGEVGTLTIEAYNNGSPVLEDSEPVTDSIAKGITFIKPGTYTFSIEETEVNGGTSDMENDAHTATITVVVTDAGGKLEITSSDITYDNSGALTEADRAVTNAAAFTNSYDAPTYTVEIPVTVNVAQGGNVAAGAESFAIAAAWGLDLPSEYANDVSLEVLGTPVATEGEGAYRATVRVSFTQRAWEAFVVDAGVTITQSGSGAEGWTYDSASYRVGVQFDEQTGEASIGDITLNGESVDAVAFTNTYTKNETPTPDPDPDNPGGGGGTGGAGGTGGLAATGDASAPLVAIALALALACVALACTGLATRKRTNH